MGELRVSITSPEGQVFQGNASSVVVPEVSGELAILPRHAPMIVRLGSGELRIRVVGLRVSASGVSASGVSAAGLSRGNPAPEGSERVGAERGMSDGGMSDGGMSDRGMARGMSTGGGGASRPGSLVRFFVDGGFVQVRDDRVNVLATSVEPLAKLTPEIAEDRFRELLGNRPDRRAPDAVKEKFFEQVQIARQRLRVARRGAAAEDGR